jgi:PAS domain S-box-containing protein
MSQPGHPAHDPGITQPVIEIPNAEQRLLRVLNSLFAFVGLLTPEGIVLEANQAPLKAAGLSIEDVRGKSFEECYWWSYSTQVQAQLRDAINKAARGEASRYDVEVRMAEGKMLAIDFMIAPMIDDGGHITHLVPSAVDITVRRNAERALQEAKEQLARANRNLEDVVYERTARLRQTVADLEQFSYSISHDMRAPLRAMTSFSLLLLQENGEKLDEQGRDYLRRIASAARRLDDLIHDVLTYSRMIRAEMILVPVDLDQLVRDIVQQYPSFSAERADIIIESPLLTVAGNIALLTQCISNLLGNAVKFVDPGTRPKVRVWTEEHDGWTRLYIRDNGIGVVQAHHDRIWRMFERLHDQSLYEGTGIGLSIVKRAVQRMGGSAGVKSATGKGSVFWLQLASAS